VTERIRFTECLDLDVDAERWLCHGCGRALVSARESYKKGCLVAERDPRDIHAPVLEGEFTFSPDPAWSRILEFYCPGCGRQIETEYLPPGHPITHDIELDVDSLKRRLAAGDLVVKDGKLADGRSEQSGQSGEDR
jgi:acetone carboxylase gamma subunit